MANSYISSGGFEYSLISVGGKWSWRVVVNNIPSATQKYYVTDISSPFGDLFRVAQPIPGDVIEAMAESLTSFQTQLNPALSLVSPSSVSVTVTEAGPRVSAGAITVTNAGALGSFMQTTATASVEWLSVNPGIVNGLGKNALGSFNISVNPATLLNSASPYTAFVNLYEPKTGVTIPVAYTINVLPQSVIWANATALSFTYDINTDLLSSPQIVTVQNYGAATSVLQGYVSKVQNVSPWLTITPVAFGPLLFGESSEITFTPRKSGITKIPGIYTETVVIVSDLAENSPYSITVTLTVT